MLTKLPKAEWKPAEASETEFLFDAEIPAKYIRFIEKHCKQPDGLNPGKPIKVIDWQREVIEPLLGTMRWSKEHNQYVRQFVDVFIGIAKKNGKTTIIAALCLALVVLESTKEKQDIVVVAADKDQAGILFEAAQSMILMNPKLREAFKVRTAVKEIEHRKSRGKIRVKSSDNPKRLYGPKPTVVIIDELVAQKNDEIYRTLHSSIVGKKEPLFICITTAGYKNESPFAYEKWQDAKKTQEDQLRNTKQLVWINEFPEDADHSDRELWAEYNPSIGITKSIEGMELLYDEALRMPTLMSEFRAFQLNQWVDAGVSWIPSHIWLKSGGDANAFDEELLAKQNRTWYGGLDLSKGVDFSSWSLISPGSPTDPNADGWTVLVRSWVSEDSVNARKDYLKRQIIDWSQSPHMGTPWVTICPGSDIRQKDVEAQVIKDCETFNVEIIGADPHLAPYLAQNLGDLDIDVVSITQYYINLSEPTKAFEHAVVNRRMWHGHNPVLSWHVGNVVLMRDTNGNVKPNKQKKKEAIDGVAATLNALHVAMRLEEPSFEQPQFIPFFED